MTSRKITYEISAEMEGEVIGTLIATHEVEMLVSDDMDRQALLASIHEAIDALAAKAHKAVDEDGDHA